MTNQLSIKNSAPKAFDVSYEEFLPFFDSLTEGVLITDRIGKIIYYNAAMAKIDELGPDAVIGKKMVEIYDLSETDSLAMQCLADGQPIIDRPRFYRTRRGKVANTIHTVYPLFKKSQIQGVICLVRDYNVLEETFSLNTIPRPKRIPLNETRFDFDAIVGSDSDFLRAVNTAKMAANTPSPVMIFGETGTGKELFAQAIHNHSSRRRKRYTAVNCAAIPETLLEGLLFGTTSGAFTGAQNKQGLFERASGGTIFLDELNSMAMGLQAKILRVIQERKVRRLGSLQETEIDVKIISSVNKDPHIAISENDLRPDLFYRLGVVFIPIPPLRERKEDIILLVRHFLVKHSRALNRKVDDISAGVLELFQDYDWPGNVRELEHVIEGAINLMVSSRTVKRHHLQSHLTIWRQTRRQAEIVQPPVAVEVPNAIRNGEGLREIQTDVERSVLIEALTRHQGNVAKAARSIGISRPLLCYKMKKHCLDRRDYQA